MKNLLIVDDEKMIRQGIRAMIAKEGLYFSNIYEAKNGKEAWEILQKEPIAVLLTDIYMPVMDGIALIEKVYQQNLDTHSIILSAYEDFEYARKAIAYGVSSYLVKPIDKQEFLSVMQSIDKKLQKTVDTSLQTQLLGEKERPPAVALALDYIDQHYREDISLSHIAEHVSMNYSYFSQLFASATGYTFVDYLRTYRIVKSKILLKNTNMKIYEIAKQTGFTDARQYTRAFRGELGCSPTQYRANALG